MKTHQWILPVVMQTRTGPAESPASTLESTLAGTARTDPSGRAARGILILTLVLGGFGAGAAATSGQVSGHHTAGNVRHGASVHLTSSVHAISHPWMY
jgi:hypothetical protein